MTAPDHRPYAGPTDLVTAADVAEWLRERAERALLGNCHPPTHVLHYAVVTFADGETYSGRFDLTDEPERLETHIRAHLVAFSGTAPAHRTQEQWDRFLNDCVPVAKREEAARFLATYELG